MNYWKRHKVRVATATVTDVHPTYTDIVAAQSGYAVSVLQLFASNRDAQSQSIAFYDETTKITPSIVVGSSGLFSWDSPANVQLELVASSGLRASISDVIVAPTNGFEVTAYYLLFDDRTPISKEAARAATYIASQAQNAVTRTPNRFGGQSES